MISVGLFLFPFFLFMLFVFSPTEVLAVDSVPQRVVDAVQDGVMSVFKGAVKIFSFPLVIAIRVFLLGVQQVASWMLALTGMIFAAAIDPNMISGPNGLLNKEAVKNVWIMVRDILNMFFILVLLFSAFCTIFQVEKWNLKKMWLNILINALLVNFSFPIARFIIDISNIMMYYFVNQLFSFAGMNDGSSIYASFFSAMHFTNIIMPGHFYENPISYQIAMIGFTIVMAVTFGTIAGLFIMRLVALVVLIMFSPVGFVGYILPETSQYANKWWTNLFKYSFSGPLMILMLGICLKITNAIGQENMQIFRDAASKNGAGKELDFFAALTFFFIPVALLWTGLGVIENSGLIGAKLIVGKAKDVAKWASLYNWGKKNVDAYKAKRAERQKEMDKVSLGGKLGDRANDIQDTAMHKLGSKKAGERLEKRKEARRREIIKKEMEGHDGYSDEQLYNMIETHRAKVRSGAKLTENEKIQAAALEKTALARGATYRDYVETTKVRPAISTADIEARAVLNGAAAPPSFSPPTSTVPVPPPTATAAELAKYQADITAEHQRAVDEHKEKTAQWIKAKEKAEKEIKKILEQASAEESRRTINEAEKPKV